MDGLYIMFSKNFEFVEKLKEMVAIGYCYMKENRQATLLFIVFSTIPKNFEFIDKWGPKMKEKVVISFFAWEDMS